MSIRFLRKPSFLASYIVPVFSNRRFFHTTMSVSSWSPEGSIPQSLKEQIDRIKESPYLNKLKANSSSTSAIANVGNLFIFLNIVQELKKTPRTGWLNFQIKNPESISDHMYRMGIIAMLSNNKDIDLAKCVRIALVHDIAEAIVGDITPEDPMTKEEKHSRELRTIEYLSNDILKPFNESAAKELYDLWNEYENVSTPEARFVKDVDKFELMVQTFEYEQQNGGEKNLEIFMNSRSQIKTEEVSQWADAYLELRKEYWNSLEKK